MLKKTQNKRRKHFIAAIEISLRPWQLPSLLSKQLLGFFPIYLGNFTDLSIKYGNTLFFFFLNKIFLKNLSNYLKKSWKFICIVFRLGLETHLGKHNWEKSNAIILFFYCMKQFSLCSILWEFKIFLSTLCSKKHFCFMFYQRAHASNLIAL